MPNKKLQYGVVVVAAVAMLAACTRAAVPPIAFTIGKLPVMPLSHQVDMEIAPIVLPPATGGKGAVSYSLVPEIPGLNFDAATRTLSGTPTAVGDHDMTYSATDEKGSVQTITFKFMVTAIPETPPGIEGTWKIEGWRNREGVEDVRVVTIAGGRWVNSGTVYDASGAITDDWYDSGGVTLTDTTVELIFWYGDRQESVVKRYYWGDAEHQVLYVECWGCRHPARSLSLLERVPPPTEADLYGTWEYSSGDGNLMHTMTISTDGRFSFSTDYRPDDYVGIVTGSVVDIDIERQVVNLSDLVLHEPDREPKMKMVPGADDGFGRFAYAADLDGRLRISNPWNEPPVQKYTFDKGYVGRELPYGEYEGPYTKVSE